MLDFSNFIYLNSFNATQNFFSHEIFIPRFPLLTCSYIILMKFQWNINTAVIKCQDYAGWYAGLSLCWNGKDRMAASFYKESMGIRHGESAFSEIWWNPGFFFSSSSFFCCATCRFDHDASNASRDSILQNKFALSLRVVSFSGEEIFELKLLKNRLWFFEHKMIQWYFSPVIKHFFFFLNEIILFSELKFSKNFYRRSVGFFFFFFLENRDKKKRGIERNIISFLNAIINNLLNVSMPIKRKKKNYLFLIILLKDIIYLITTMIKYSLSLCT